VIQAHAVVGAHVVLGPDNFVGYGAVLGGDPQDLSFDPATKSSVRIGAGNKIREYCTIHRATTEGAATTVGDGCFLMAGAHLGHDVQLGDGVILANNVLLGGHVEVGDRVFVGGGTVVHQHTRIGRLAICQGLSGFSKFVPPFVMAAQVNGVAGLNVVGLRRAGFHPDQRAEIKSAFDLLYRRGLNVTQALAAAAAQSWGAEASEFWSFIRGARQKGICDLISSRGTGPTEGE
jgi:UDP-N-acetylglucosamine acyltransferase